MFGPSTPRRTALQGRSSDGKSGLQHRVVDGAARAISPMPAYAHRGPRAAVSAAARGGSPAGKRDSGARVPYASAVLAPAGSKPHRTARQLPLDRHDPFPTERNQSALSQVQSPDAFEMAAASRPMENLYSAFLDRSPAFPTAEPPPVVSGAHRTALPAAGDDAAAALSAWGEARCVTSALDDTTEKELHEVLLRLSATREFLRQHTAADDVTRRRKVEAASQVTTSLMRLDSRVPGSSGGQWTSGFAVDGDRHSIRHGSAHPDDWNGGARDSWCPPKLVISFPWERSSSPEKGTNFNRAPSSGTQDGWESASRSHQQLSWRDDAGVGAQTTAHSGYPRSASSTDPYRPPPVLVDAPAKFNQSRYAQQIVTRHSQSKLQQQQSERQQQQQPRSVAGVHRREKLLSPVNAGGVDGVATRGLPPASDEPTIMRGPSAAEQTEPSSAPRPSRLWGLNQTPAAERTRVPPKSSIIDSEVDEPDGTTVSHDGQHQHMPRHQSLHSPSRDGAHEDHTDVALRPGSVATLSSQQVHPWEAAAVLGAINWKHTSTPVTVTELDINACGHGDYHFRSATSLDELLASL